MEKIIIPLAVIAVLLLIIVGAGLLIKAKLSKVSREMFGTSDIIKGLNEQNKQLSETPRSLHSMTDVYLPSIQRDFPEFDYEHFRTGAQAVLRGYFNAVSTGSTDTLPKEITLSLKDHIREIIVNLGENRQRQYYLEPVLHDTQIARYIKSGGAVTVLFNIAVGMYSYLEDENGKVINGSKDTKLQTVYEVELLYVQDADKMGVYSEALGLNCPNCGAPVRNLGMKFCEYCGTGLIEVNTRVWKFNAVNEQTKRRTAF